MTLVFGVFVSIALLSPIACATAQQEAPRTAADARTKLADFAIVADQARKALEVPGAAVVVVKDGEVVFSAGVGQRDVERDLPVTPRTLFGIGSSTKAFTTFVLGTLVDEGKLDLDKPVTTWLPEFRLHDPIATDRITPRDLVTHRSGLPRHDALWYVQPNLTRAEMVARIRFLPESRDFRTDFQYNNLMFLTAGYLEEKVTGKSWEDLVRERIFVPLGMKRSNFSVEESQKDADFAKPYDDRDDKVTSIPFRNITHVGPAGSINSCVDDLASWLRLHLSNGDLDGKHLLAKGTLDDLHTPRMIMTDDGALGGTADEARMIGYALGWFHDEYHGYRRIHHGGHIDGFSALVLMVPQERIGIAVLTNKNVNDLPELLVRLALDRLLPGVSPTKDRIAGFVTKRETAKKLTSESAGNRELARKKGTSPSHALDDFAGAYEHPGYGRIEISRSDSGLALTFGTESLPLEHWHYDVFAGKKKDSPFDGLELQFITDLSGEISALRAQVEPAVDPLEFARLPDSRLKDPAYLARFVGRYALPEKEATVELAGNTLRLTILGQPSFDLEPSMHDTFSLDAHKGFRVQFVLDAAGDVVSLRVFQPDGAFEGKRVR